MSVWAEIVIRFFIGGTIVSAFALVGEMVAPKTFAGIFGAAPSVAIATLILTFVMHGFGDATIECRSMLLGGMAFVGYSTASVFIVQRHGLPVWLEAGLNWATWLAIAFGLWAVAPIP